MTPIQFYNQLVSEREIQPDLYQQQVLEQFQALYEQLNPSPSFFASFRKKPLLKGIYLWGDVGVGKTFLLDSFYECLTLPKLRKHFHAFMRMVHEQLALHKGKKAPLKLIAADIAKRAKVLCFDELIVNDIADAMIIGKLLEALFSKGVCICATSNSEPDKLYWNGLQREQFLPAIDLIKDHLNVISLKTKRDYRLLGEKINQRYWVPSDHAAKMQLKKIFLEYSSGEGHSQEPILICGRYIPVKLRATHCIWFDFMDICGIPRSPHDYLELAEKFKTIFISDIPVILPTQKDLIRELIYLVDVFYDAKVQLILAADANPVGLYPEGPFLPEYARTASRLLEMQSDKWRVN